MMVFLFYYYFSSLAVKNKGNKGEAPWKVKSKKQKEITKDHNCQIFTDNFLREAQNNTAFYQSEISGPGGGMIWTYDRSNA